MNIRPEVEAIKNILIQWRRDFHQYPELGFEEHRTSSIIAETLISFGMSPKTGVGKTGVTADLNFGEGPTIALRADMDALPMQETSGLSFSSKHDGVMHACGHDGHMAMLLGAAKILSQMDKELTGTIRFIFQPAEEGEGGARYMIEDGCLEGVDEIYGIHVWTVDAVIVAAHLIQTLQTIVSRNTNPLESTVITIGEINGGHNFNIIADKVRLAGTTRAYTKENRSMIQRRMQEIIDGIAKSFGAEITFNYTDGYPPTINHAGPVKKVLQAAGKVVGPGAGEPYLSMGGEDFSYYLQKVPGCFFFVGSAPDGQRQFSTPHHCSHFNMDESALSVGTSVYLHLVEDILG